MRSAGGTCVRKSTTGVGRNPQSPGSSAAPKSTIWLCAAESEQAFCNRSCRPAQRVPAGRPHRLPRMVHLRIVAPERCAEEAMDLLCGTESVINVIRLEERARRPDGVVMMCDVAREDASVVVADLKRLDIQREGSIALELVD